MNEDDRQEIRLDVGPADGNPLFEDPTKVEVDRDSGPFGEQVFDPDAEVEVLVERARMRPVIRLFPGARVAKYEPKVLGKASETKVLLSEEELAALPEEVRLTLAGDHIGALIAATPNKQAPLISEDEMARLEADGEPLDEDDRGAGEIERDTIRGLAQDGHLPTGEDGLIEPEVWNEMFGADPDDESANRRRVGPQFDNRTRLKDSGHCGTRYRYVHGRCRCDLCTEANRVYIAELRRQRREERERGL